MNLRIKGILGIALIVAIVASGCSSGGDTVKDIDLNKLADDIMSGVEFTDELVKLSDNAVEDFYSLPDGSVKSYIIYKSASGATAEEFALFDAGDPKNVDSIKSSVDERIEDLKFGFEGYVPEEMKKLGDAVIFTKGKYVFLGICDSPDSIKTIFEQAFK